MLNCISKTVPNCKLKLHCKDISEVQREQLFKYYWSLGGEEIKQFLEILPTKTMPIYHDVQN